MNVADPINILGVFAGGGMHDTAVAIALETLGYDVRAVGYVERDSAAAAMLLARMENATLHPAPVWIDCISRMDARPLRGFVDLIVASPPCQPYSSAGKRRGNEDHRSHGADDAPLPHLVRVIAECEPAVVWFENVPEWFTDGHFRGFGEELCRLGFGIAPPEFVSASDVGGPHGRERVYCLVVHPERLRAWQGEQGEHAGIVHGDRLADPGEPVGDAGGPEQGREQEPERGPDQRDAAGGTGGELADAPGRQQQGPFEQRGRKGSRIRRDAERTGAGVALPARRGLGAGRQPPRSGGQHDGRGGQLADAQGAGREGTEPARDGRADGRARKQRGFVRPLFPPGRPIFDDELAEYCRRDSATLGALRARIAGTAAALRQWHGLVADGLDPAAMPAVERGLPVVVDGASVTDGPADLLRIGGNGVVPLAVADAFVRLWVEHVVKASKKEVRG